MTVDDLLNEFLSEVGYPTPDISRWKWHGTPGFTSAFATVEKEVDWSIGYLIQISSDADCLKSKSEYVRECKSWLNNNSIPAREWLYGLGVMAGHLMRFTARHQAQKPATCCCGAKHTSFPSLHSTWCDAYVQT